MTNEKEDRDKVFDPLFNSINPLRRLPPKPFSLENNSVRQTSRYRDPGECIAGILFRETLCVCVQLNENERNYDEPEMRSQLIALCKNCGNSTVRNMLQRGNKRVYRLDGFATN